MINDLKAKLIQQAMMFKMIHTSSPSTSTSTLLFRSSVIPDNLIEIKAATLLSIKMCYLEKTKKKKEEKKKQQTTQSYEDCRRDNEIIKVFYLKKEANLAADYRCDLDRELRPPALRPSVQSLIEEGRKASQVFDMGDDELVKRIL
ncbi:hypothetical protein SSS_05179 [Sarcoptes scabiei]|uniref:Uncharacterized protein n=1 Tax=Sarcoptes scabiei TaxID=52283 RepID=A0A834VHW9_SARSC|nr:hypothetical protein SSS_05179 [Sarcoptes scabiei]